MSLEDDLTNAIGDFKFKLDTRPQGKVETTVQSSVETRTTSFNAQLISAHPSNRPDNGTANNDGQQTAPIAPAGGPSPTVCAGYVTTATVVISGYTSVTPPLTDPNGSWVLPLLTPPGAPFPCQWEATIGNLTFNFTFDPTSGGGGISVDDSASGSNPIFLGISATFGGPYVNTVGGGGSATAS